MFQLIENGTCAPVFVQENEKSWVYLAAEDLLSDLCYIAGAKQKDKLHIGQPALSGIFIGTLNGNTPADSDAYLGAVLPEGKEGYAITVREDSITILGADDLGTMWGIYTFCEEILKIPPYYLFDGVLPRPAHNYAVSRQTITGRPKTFGFRGFFLNDEDLLTEFKDSGGRRQIDYPFYSQVISPDVMEKVAETALRLKLNLIIPSSFIDIDNPAEEALVSVCAKRGLYVSQHHIEPMGVSYFTFQNYMNARHGGGEVSFISNRERIIEIWRYYAEKWAKYPRVIWQFGLRGKADRPVWLADRQVGNTPQERGALISDAIKIQSEIVKDILGTDAFHSTVTLWMEGAELFNQGALSVPNSTVIVFSDIGYNQLWSDDFWKVPRENGRKYGVYYHAQFWNWGPHLTEGTAPEKMRYCLKTASDTGCGDYIILNISNLREFTMSAFGFSKMTWDLDNANDTVTDYCTSLYGDVKDAAAALYMRYFDAFAEGSCELLRWYCDKNNFNYHEYEALPFKNLSLNDGFLRRFAQDLMTGDEHFHDDDLAEKFEMASKRFLSVYHDAAALSVPDGAPKEHLQNSLVLQSFTMYCLYNYARFVKLGTKAAETQNKKAAREYCVQAAECLDSILTKRMLAETGYFSGWYRGDKKMNIAQMKEDVLKFMERI